MTSQQRLSKTLGVLEAQLLLLLHRFLTAGVVHEVWALFLQDGHEVAADEQAVQQFVAHLALLDCSYQLHKVLAVYVVGLKLHLYLQTVVGTRNRILHQFSEGLDHVHLCLVHAVPLVLSVGDLENLPVLGLLAGILLDGRQDLVDKEGYFEVLGIVHQVCESVQRFCEVRNGSSDELGHVFECEDTGGGLNQFCPFLFLCAFERVLDELLGSDALSVLNGEHASHQHLQILTHWNLGGEAKDGIIDQTHQLRDCALLVWANSEQHLVQNDSQRPDVRPYVVDESLEHFWRHVDGRPDHGLRHVTLLQQLLAEPEIGQLDHPVVEEDIGGLEVSMQNVFGMQRLEGIPQLVENLDSFLLVEPALGLDVLSQRSTVTELIDEIVVVGSTEHLDELDDVGMADLGQNGDLVVGELAQLRSMLEFLNVHHLDCVDALVFAVFCFVDVAVLALPDLLLQDVVLDYLVHQRNIIYHVYRNRAKSKRTSRQHR